MIDMDPVLLSQRVWSWIQLTRHDNGNAELKSNDGEALNGLEAWRKLVVPAAARTPARRFNLRDAVQQPKGASTREGTEAAIVVWDNSLADYLAAGAETLADEDLVHSILKMLPFHGDEGESSRREDK